MMKCFVCGKQFKDKDVMGVDFYLFYSKQDRELKALKDSRAVCTACIREVGTKKIQELKEDL